MLQLMLTNQTLMWNFTNILIQNISNKHNLITVLVKSLISPNNKIIYILNCCEFLVLPFIFAVSKAKKALHSYLFVL